MRPYNIFLFYIFLLLLFCSCSFFSPPQKISLWTQSPEIIPFIERYNTSQNNFKIEVKYLASLPLELISSEKAPDLVFAEYLSAPEIANNLQSLQDLLKPGIIDPELFYQKLLVNHRLNNNQVCLPFNFHLPLLVFRKGLFAHQAEGALSLERLKEISLALNKTSKSGLLALGFAPHFNSDFPIYMAQLYQSQWRADAVTILSWQEKSLASFLAAYADWVQQNTLGLVQELAFINLYLYEPPYKIISNKQDGYQRLSCYLTLDQDFFCLPELKTVELDFAWLSKEGEIVAADKVLGWGIPKKAINRPGAQDFLKWIYTPTNQALLMAQQKEINPFSFGLGGGFSALKAINEKELIKLEPRLAGRIPQAEKILFFLNLPYDWDKIKREILIPWFQLFLKQDPELKPLKTYLKR